MKKSLSLVLVLALICSMFALVGCGGEEGGDDADTISVAVVASAGFGDLSFNDSAQKGGQRLEADLGLEVEYIECKGENFKQRLMDAADEFDIVVPVGWEFYEIGDVAKEYPDTKFIWVDNSVDGIEQYPNLLCITYAQNEGSFLVGYVAAMMSKTGVVGAVGGMDNPTINDFIVGYEQGAKYANPDVKVVKRYAGDFEDPAMGKECALSLNGEGADVIFQIAGNTGNGVFEAAKEKGFYAIGVDQDQKISAPNFDDIIICSMIKEVGTSIYDAIYAYATDGTWEGGREWVADMTTGYIDVVYGGEDSTQQIGDEIKATVKELAGKIVSGEIVVDTARQ